MSVNETYHCAMCMTSLMTIKFWKTFFDILSLHALKFAIDLQLKVLLNNNSFLVQRLLTHPVLWVFSYFTVQSDLWLESFSFWYLFTYCWQKKSSEDFTSIVSLKACNCTMYKIIIIYCPSYFPTSRTLIQTLSV